MIMYWIYKIFAKKNEKNKQKFDIQSHKHTYIRTYIELIDGLRHKQNL